MRAGKFCTPRSFSGNVAEAYLSASLSSRTSKHVKMQERLHSRTIRPVVLALHLSASEAILDLLALIRNSVRRAGVYWVDCEKTISPRHVCTYKTDRIVAEVAAPTVHLRRLESGITQLSNMLCTPGKEFLPNLGMILSTQGKIKGVRVVGIRASYGLREVINLNLLEAGIAEGPDVGRLT